MDGDEAMKREFVTNLQVLIFVGMGLLTGACTATLDEEELGDIQNAMALMDGGGGGVDAGDAGPGGGTDAGSVADAGGSGPPPSQADLECSAYNFECPSTCQGLRFCDPNNCVGTEPWCCASGLDPGNSPPGPYVCDSFSTTNCEECACDCVMLTNDQMGAPPCDQGSCEHKTCYCVRPRTRDGG